MDRWMYSPAEVLEYLDQIPPSPWVAILFSVVVGIPILLWLVSMVAINYTYGYVVGTLAIVEDTTQTADQVSVTDNASENLPSYSDGPNNKPSNELPAAASTQPPPPPLDLITSSLHKTTKHLKLRGGQLARFRGASLGLLLFAVPFLVSNIVSEILERSCSVNKAVQTTILVLADVLLSVALARLHLAWTHIVLTVPSSKPWWRRLPSRAATNKIYLPTLAWSAAQALTWNLSSVLADVWLYPVMEAQVEEGEILSLMGLMGLLHQLLALTGVVASSLAAAMFIWYPAQIAFRRAQAALLPENESTVIPVDRTYGGLFLPGEGGSAGKRPLAGASREFDKQSRKRVLEVYGNTVLLFAVATLAWGLIALLTVLPFYLTVVRWMQHDGRITFDGTVLWMGLHRKRPAHHFDPL